MYVERYVDVCRLESNLIFSRLIVCQLTPFYIINALFAKKNPAFTVLLSLVLFFLTRPLVLPSLLRYGKC